MNRGRTSDTALVTENPQLCDRGFFEVLHHPQLGRLTLQCAVLQGRAPGQRLFLFRAAADSPANERLAALARRRRQTSPNRRHASRD